MGFLGGNTAVSTALVLGWEEWVSLPDLGLPAIKAKVDTGARTSALHAASIEPFGPVSAPMVRFVVRPHPSKPDIEIVCSAPVIGRRDVTSSNGERESRFVIATTVAIGRHAWPIEVTLTNREAMSYRMLLGRQAIRSDMIVEPGASFRQPRLSYRPYLHLPRRDPVRRPLRLALVTHRPEAPSNRSLAAAARTAGHVLELIDPRRAALTFDATTPGVRYDGRPLGHFDGIVPRLGGALRHAPALVRQLEAMGSFSLNSADALERLQHPLGIIQALTEAGVGNPPPVVALDAVGATAADEEAQDVLRFLVVDHKIAAAIEMRNGRFRAPASRVPVKARRAARRASHALRLGLAGIDVVLKEDRAGVVAVTGSPLLTPFARLAEVDVAEAIIAAVESHVQSWTRRTDDAAVPAER